MKFTIRFADKIVGTLVLLALAILIIVVFMIGRSQRWFAKDYQYLTYYSSASGLSVNMAVQYMGITIGHVNKIKLVKDSNDINDLIEVTFSIFEEYKDRVRTGSMVEIQVSPIGLGNTFIFYSGKGAETIPEGSVIPELSSPLAKQYIAAGLASLPDTGGGSINNIIVQFNDVLEKINSAITGPDAEGNTAIQQIIIDIETLTQGISRQMTPILNNLGAFSGQLTPIMDNLGTVTDKMSDPSGSIMSLLDSEGSIYSELTTSLESIAGILDNLDKTSEVLPSNLPGLLINLNAALRSAQDVMIALTNNPLLRRGVPEHREASPGGSGSRNQEF